MNMPGIRSLLTSLQIPTISQFSVLCVLRIAIFVHGYVDVRTSSGVYLRVHKHSARVRLSARRDESAQRFDNLSELSVCLSVSDI